MEGQSGSVRAVAEAGADSPTAREPSTRRLIGAAGFAALLAAAALLYGRRLTDVPAQLGWDEVFFALAAHSIATTGRDTEGTFLPLYFHFAGGAYYLPMIVYSIAGVFKVLPVSEFAIRLPTLIVGLMNVALASAVAWQIFKRRWAALLTGALMATTPAHYIHSRFALDYIFPLPFIFVWLWCMAAFVERPRPWLVAGGTLALGVGFYSYMASAIMMPFYLGLTLVVVAIGDGRQRPRYFVELLAFLLPLSLLAIFMLRHPTFFRDQIMRYRVYDARRYTPLQGVKEFLNYQNLTHRVSMYWDYLGPNYLFLSGGTKMTMTTRRVGVFLTPLILVLPVGLYRAVTVRRDVMAWLLAAGFLTAPLAALLVDDAYAIDRELNLLPFGVLLAALGVVRLMESPRLRVRALAVIALLLAAWNFASFQRDYFTLYREESATWFERNIRSAIEDIIARTDPASSDRIFVNNEIGNVESYWRLYAIKHRRPDIVARAFFFKPSTFDVHSVPSGTLFLSVVEDPWQSRQVSEGQLRQLLLAREPDGAPSYVVLQRP